MLTAIASNLDSSVAPAIQVLGGPQFSYQDLAVGIKTLCDDLAERALLLGKKKLCVGVLIRNSPEWIVSDLALLFGGHLEVPVPVGFSKDQCQYLLADVDFCIVGSDLAHATQISFIPSDKIIIAKPLESGRTRAQPFPYSPGNQDDPVKAIHTSGTTSAPKGVLVGLRALTAKITQLLNVIEPAALQRYLSVVPFSLLLEQICAIYLPLSHGGTIVLLPEGEDALTGGHLPASHYLRYLPLACPTFMTVPPSIVEGLLQTANDSGFSGDSLLRAIFGRASAPLIACGGAPIAPSVLRGLADHGVPVYEGYGLSENTSVLSWNLPGATKIGTVGRPLPGCEVRIAADGEVLIRSNSLFSGYKGRDPSTSTFIEDGFLATGDLGSLDAEGYLSITGRKKSVIINSSGRKISLEWVESILAAANVPGRACVFGDTQSYPVAAIFLHPETEVETSAVISALRSANAELPDYARIRNFFIVTLPHESIALYITITDRPRRDQIARDFSEEIRRASSETNHLLTDLEEI